MKREMFATATATLPVQLLTPNASLIPLKFDPFPTPFISTTASRCLILDSDETLGSFSLGSLLYSMYMNLCACPPPRDFFIEQYLRSGGARPGLVHLLQSAASMIKGGRLDHVVLFTAASNVNGWVTFLRECLENLAEVPSGTISRTITMEHCKKRHKTGRVIKDLRCICSDTSRLVMVDDKPQFVQHGRVIHVGEYSQFVDISSFVEKLPCAEESRVVARRALIGDLVRHKPDYRSYKNDQTLFRVTEIVEALFPAC